jgi:hypothetical protein
MKIRRIEAEISCAVGRTDTDDEVIAAQRLGRDA